MKAGIITIVKNAVDESFGPAMQIYAVQQILRDYGIEPETIVDETVKRSFSEKILRGMDEFTKGPQAIKFIIQKGFTKSPQKMSEGITEEQKALIQKRRMNYGKFIQKYIKISDIKEQDLLSGDDRINNYEYFVVGSDQVWNPYYPQKDEIKYLQFCDRKKRVPFSPSIARNDIPRRFRHRFINGINGFDRLCIRENEGRDIIRKYTGREATVVLDPTMMIDASQYKSISKHNSNLPNCDFSFNYFMGTNINKDKIEKFSRDYVEQSVWMRDFHSPDYYVMNPMEYIDAINRAKIICTDSFHVSVFAILLRKPLVVFPKDEGGKVSTNSRLKTLLETFQMERCYVDQNYKLDNSFTINYDKVNDILDEKKKESFSFYNAIFLK